MITADLEKTFMNFITDNKRYYEIVKPHYFRNNEIQFVYEVIRNYCLENHDAQKPSPKQIWEMVSQADMGGLITKEILKSILTYDVNDYDIANFITPQITTWILSNRLKSGSVDIAEKIRELDSSNRPEDIMEKANVIKSIADDMSSLNFIEDGDDLGSDFDDAERHLQDTAKNKISSGYVTIDHMLGGGWDAKTLNILLSATNGGKSLWMQNLAVKAADSGRNVLYITLEMTEPKVMKRLGAMRLNIPINSYDSVSQDTDAMQAKIDNLRTDNGLGGISEKKIGKIFTKFWAAGTTTVPTFEAFVTRLQVKKNIKIDMIVVDYITLIASPKSSGGDSLYTRGKYLAESLRAMGDTFDCPVLTAIQISKDAWNAADIEIESISESKAIAETADTMFAIIRTPQMRADNKYRLKLLKQRDGDFLKSQVRFDLDPIHLVIGNDEFLDV